MRSSPGSVLEGWARSIGRSTPHVACVYALLGDVDKAMAWLERAVDTGFPCWPFFRIDPHLENLWDEPAFSELMTDLEQKYPARESSF